MLAALRLAVRKSARRVIVAGDPEFRERTFAMAVKYGLADALADADLAQRWRALQPSLPQPDKALAERLSPPPAAAVGPSLSPLPPARPAQGANDDMPASPGQTVPAASPSANVIKRPIPVAKRTAMPERVPQANVLPPASTKPKSAVAVVDQSKRGERRNANPPRLSKGPSDIDFPPGFSPHGRGAGRQASAGTRRKAGVCLGGCTVRVKRRRRVCSPRRRSDKDNEDQECGCRTVAQPGRGHGHDL